MSSTILNDRDTNQSMQNQNSNPFLTKESGNGLENSQPKSMDFHRKMMEKKLKAQEQEQEQEQGQGQGQEGDGYDTPAGQLECVNKLGLTFLTAASQVHMSRHPMPS